MATEEIELPGEVDIGTISGTFQEELVSTNAPVAFMMFLLTSALEGIFFWFSHAHSMSPAHE